MNKSSLLILNSKQDTIKIVLINLGYSLYFKIANSTLLEPPNSRHSSKNHQTEITVIKEGEYISSNAFRGNSQEFLGISCLPTEETQETWVLFLVRKDSPRRGHDYPFQYSCLENPHGKRSLAGYSPQGHKESDRTEVTQQSIAMPSEVLILLIPNQKEIQGQESSRAPNIVIPYF